MRWLNIYIYTYETSVCGDGKGGAVCIALVTGPFTGEMVLGYGFEGWSGLGEVEERMEPHEQRL